MDSPRERVVTRRGDVFWVDLGGPSGSAPAKRRPVLIISADTFNPSRLRTVLAATITSNSAVAARPGNVFLPATATGLWKDSVVPARRDVRGVSRRGAV